MFNQQLEQNRDKENVGQVKLLFTTISFGVLLLLAVVGALYFKNKIGSKSEQQTSPDKILSQGETSISSPIVIKSADLSVIITKNDVDIDESYQGATWTDDSHSVYFAKYVRIKLSQEKLDKIEKEILRWEVQQVNKIPSGKKMDEAMREKILSASPRFTDFDRILYEKLLIFRYDISDKKVQLITASDFHPGGSPFHLDFRDSLNNDELQYGNWDGIHILNLKDHMRVTAGDVNTTMYDAHFSTRSNGVEIGDGDRGLRRIHFSPNRHGSIQFEELKNADYQYNAKQGFNFAPDVVGIFYDAGAQLKTAEELGWKAGIPREYMPEALNRYRPQYFIDPKLLRSSEEEGILARLQLAQGSVQTNTNKEVTQTKPSLVESRDRARTADLENMKFVIESYYADNQRFPNASEIATLVPKYLTELPKDPLFDDPNAQCAAQSWNTAFSHDSLETTFPPLTSKGVNNSKRFAYIYQTAAGNKHYLLQACLENGKYPALQYDCDDSKNAPDPKCTNGNTKGVDADGNPRINEMIYELHSSYN